MKQLKFSITIEVRLKICIILNLKDLANRNKKFIFVLVIINKIVVELGLRNHDVVGNNKK